MLIPWLYVLQLFAEMLLLAFSSTSEQLLLLSAEMTTKWNCVVSSISTNMWYSNYRHCRTVMVSTPLGTCLHGLGGKLLRWHRLRSWIKNISGMEHDIKHRKILVNRRGLHYMATKFGELLSTLQRRHRQSQTNNYINQQQQQISLHLSPLWLLTIQFVAVLVCRRSFWLTRCRRFDHTPRCLYKGM